MAPALVANLHLGLGLLQRYRFAQDREASLPTLPTQPRQEPPVRCGHWRNRGPRAGKLAPEQFTEVVKDPMMKKQPMTRKQEEGRRW